ncbi:MAG: zinc ribbon domain-containing protein [Kiritimatiellae bacterium]|nr:zinc ribbon domain-containing protein [Kiritimatiellia bacterium]
MSDIQLQCLGCSKAFLVSDDQAGLLVPCPQCGRQIAVPVPSDQAERAPKLALRREGPLAAVGMNCPSCGATMPPGAVLCVECGYDVRKGVRLGETPGWPPYVRWLIAGAGVIIVVMLVKTFLRPHAISEIAAPAPAVQAPPPAPTAPVPAPEAAPVAEPAPAPPPVPVPPSETNAPLAEPEVSAEELTRLEADYRASLQGRLDQQQPLYRPGDVVELRKVNGLVIRGKLKSVDAQNALVLREEGEASVPLAELDRESRVRCDAAFRDKFIEYLVKKNIGSIRPPESP